MAYISALFLRELHRFLATGEQAGPVLERLIDAQLEAAG